MSPQSTITAVVAAFLLSSYADLLRAQDWLDPAVGDIKRIIANAGLPADFLPRGHFGPEEVDPLFLTGAWERIHQSSAQAFKNGFNLPQKPIGVLVCNARTPRELLAPGERHLTQVVFQGSNSAFEETMLRAAYGRDHRHFSIGLVKAAEITRLPNVRDRYLFPNGAVDYRTIASDFGQSIDNRLPNGWDRQRTDVSDRSCLVFSIWLGPYPQSRDWIQRLMRWRVVYRVLSIEGRSMDMYKIHDGQRRLIVESYIEIGFLENRYSPQRVFTAGPLRQMAFKTIGYAELNSSSWSVSFSETNEVDARLGSPQVAFSARPSTLVGDDRYKLVAAKESHLIDFAKELQQTMANQLRR